MIDYKYKVDQIHTFPPYNYDTDFVWNQYFYPENMHIMSLCWLPQHKFIKHLILYDLAMYLKNVDKTCNTSFVIVFQNKNIFRHVTF